MGLGGVATLGWLPPSCDGGLAQLARAPALQAGGHRFDSDILHKCLSNHPHGYVSPGEHEDAAYIDVWVKVREQA
jgi:hypothetical protein